MNSLSNGLLKSLQNVLSPDKKYLTKTFPEAT